MPPSVFRTKKIAAGDLFLVKLASGHGNSRQMLRDPPYCGLYLRHKNMNMGRGIRDPGYKNSRGSPETGTGIGLGRD